MKKLVILAILVSILAIPSAAQTKMEVGFKGGANLANWTGDITGNDMYFAFGGGGFARFNLSNGQITIQPEALFMMKGIGIEGTGVNWKLTYIDIPLLIKYNVPTKGSFAPNLFVGPYGGFLISAKLLDVDVKDAHKSFDYGLVFGGGFDIAGAGNGKFTFDARYALGLANIFDIPDDVEGSVKNGVISLMVGYAFGVGE